MWGAIASIGSSLIGGLFGKKKKQEKTVTESHVDYGRMVREAEAAGFNPLTALRNGGSAGFSVSTSTTPANPLSSPVAGGLAGAVENGLNHFLENYDPFRDNAKEAEFDIVQAQLNKLQNNVSGSVGFGDVPSYGSPANRVVLGMPVLATASNRKTVAETVAPPTNRDKETPYKGRVPEGHQTMEVPELDNVIPTIAGSAQPNSNPLGIQPPETKRPERINPYPSWSNLERNPWTAGAEATEDALGDNFINSTLATVSEYGHDAAWNVYRGARAVERERRALSSGTDRKKNVGMKDVVKDVWNNGFKFRGAK